jgi:small nuclear ribonucleoprotein (snRNP)-like protein
MTIDLSQFVGKYVKVILKDGSTQTGRLQLGGNYYKFYFGYCHYSYFGNGTSYWNNSHFDIVKIELVNPEQPMNIDLSQYGNKEVKVTLKNGNSHTGRLQLRGNYYKFYYDDPVFLEQCNLSYNQNGTNFWKSYQHDIVKIEFVDPEPKQITLNALESKTLDAIATTLVPEAIKYIDSHERYAEVMQALIIEFVEKNLGSENGELPFMIFDRMFLAKGRD